MVAQKMFPASPDAYKLFHEGTLALSRVERAGVKVDEKYLHKVINSTEKEIDDLEKELKNTREFRIWKRRFGDKTKLGSREQLATVLFKELGVKEPERYSLMGSADAEVLEDVDLPFVRTYLKAEKNKKLLSTYFYGIREELVDGFIHPSYNLNTIVTYRSSCADPNFQNQPNRDAESARKLRQCYIPRKKNWRLGEFDFSGIEVRIAACYHLDPVMIKYITDPTTDMHRDMAIQCFMLGNIIADMDDEALRKIFKEDKNFKNMRHCGKNMFVFPQFYGDWFAACAKAMWQAMSKNRMNIRLPNGMSLRKHLRLNGITELGSVSEDGNTIPGTFMDHMKNVEELFWNERFAIYNQWKKDNWAEYQEKGYLITKTGFRVSGDFGRNKINNTGTQGSAFHCTLWSLIEIEKEFWKRKLKTKIIAEIHDSIITDGPAEEFDEVHAICRKIMTKRLLRHWDWIIVPMEMEAEAPPPGCSWYEKKFVPPLAA